MKNFILPCFMLFSASICYAAPLEETYKDEYITVISPDGKWIAGALDEGNVIIRNLETDEVFTYFSNGGSISYYIGNGPGAVSNVGIIVGSTSGNNASYWDHDKGQWYNLKTPNPQFMSNACSVTPDGSVICGGAGNDNMSLDSEKIMLVPAVWYRQEDGFYSDAVLLPHPEKDFTGRIPQYITAVAISDDGKTVVGQIRDYAGFMQEPIVYTRGEDGEWSYTLLYPELLNPNNFEFPPYPGEYNGTPMPTEEWFMTEEEMAAYSEAVDKWTSGPFPQYTDYMTYEEYQQYLAAFDKYLEEYVPWEEAYDNYFTIYEDCINDGYSFVFNNIFLTPDGKYYGTSREITYVEDPIDGPKARRYPMILNTDGSGYTELDGSQDISLLMSSLTANEDVLATYIDPNNILPKKAYIFPSGSKEATPLEDYIADFNPDLAAWMESEMYQEIIDGIRPNGQFTYSDYMCSGSAVSTPDMSRMLCFTTTDTWTDQQMYYVSWVFDTGIKESAVKPTFSSRYEMTVLPDGEVVLDGEFRTIDIYNIAGAVVYSEKSPAGSINPNLGKGIYIFKAVTADGEEIVKKIAL